MCKDSPLALELSNEGLIYLLIIILGHIETTRRTTTGDRPKPTESPSISTGMTTLSCGVACDVV